MKKIELLMLLALLNLIGFSIYLIFFEQKIIDSSQKNDVELFKKLTIDCIVKNKFVNKANHSSKTIQFNNCRDLIIIKELDTLSFFDFVEPGDSIVKFIDTDSVKVYRQMDVNSFKVYTAIID